MRRWAGEGCPSAETRGLSASDYRRAFYALSTRHSDLKVIFVSGYRTEVVSGDPEFMRQHGNHFLHQPSPAGELIRAVRQCLPRE